MLSFQHRIRAYFHFQWVCGMSSFCSLCRLSLACDLCSLWPLVSNLNLLPLCSSQCPPPPQPSPLFNPTPNPAPSSNTSCPHQQCWFVRAHSFSVYESSKIGRTMTKEIVHHRRASLGEQYTLCWCRSWHTIKLWIAAGVVTVFCQSGQLLWLHMHGPSFTPNHELILCRLQA